MNLDNRPKFKNSFFYEIYKENSQVLRQTLEFKSEIETGN